MTLYTEQQFRDITRLPAWSNGAFDGRIRVPVEGASQNLDQFDRVLVHELTHAMIWGWLHGCARMAARGTRRLFRASRSRGGARIQARNAAMPFADLQENFTRFNAGQAAVAYEESVFAVDAHAPCRPRMAVLLEDGKRLVVR